MITEANLIYSDKKEDGMYGIPQGTAHPLFQNSWILKINLIKKSKCDSKYQLTVIL